MQFLSKTQRTFSYLLPPPSVRLGLPEVDDGV